MGVGGVGGVTSRASRAGGGRACSVRSAMSSSSRFSRNSGAGMSASQRWHVVRMTQLTLPQLPQAQLPSTPSLGAPLGHLADGAWPDWIAQIRSSRMCCGGFTVEQRWQESRVPKSTFLQPVHRLRIPPLVRNGEPSAASARAHATDTVFDLARHHAPSTPSCGAPLFCSAGLVRLTRRPRFGSHVHFSLSSSIEPISACEGAPWRADATTPLGARPYLRPVYYSYIY